jgi:hypothetical protein
VLARQVDRIVGKSQLDLRQREIGERDRLCEDDLAVAVLTAEGCSAIRLHGELPDLKRCYHDGFDAALSQRDLVEQPVGAAVVGDVFRAISEEDIADETMAIPELAAGELV